MKRYSIIFIIIIFACTPPVLADQEEYDNCLLDHLKHAKTDIATRLIKRACKENYKGGIFVRQTRKAYNECLLENLVGVESKEAAMEIQGACKRKHF